MREGFLSVCLSVYLLRVESMPGCCWLGKLRFLGSGLEFAMGSYAALFGWTSGMTPRQPQRRTPA